MEELLEKIKAAALLELARSDADLESLRVRFLGKKGELTAVLRGMGALSAEERPRMGQLANDVRAAIEAAIAVRGAELKERMLQKCLTEEKLDVTMPGEAPRMGHRHPLNRVQREMEEIFIGMGFQIAEGPEVEYDYYNFQALNIPKNHPARDTQDTFYITDNILLRSQTSPVQVRVMEKQKPPIRVISPGRVYRSDALDATHSPLFHQMEGLVVDKGITMSDLKGTLETFAKKCSARTPKSASARITSPSPSRPPKWMSPALPAAAKAAASARAKGGSKFSVPAWCILLCCPTVALIRRFTAVSLSAWALSAWP